MYLRKITCDVVDCTTSADLPLGQQILPPCWQGFLLQHTLWQTDKHGNEVHLCPDHAVRIHQCEPLAALTMEMSR